MKNPHPYNLRVRSGVSPKAKYFEKPVDALSRVPLNKKEMEERKNRMEQLVYRAE